MALARMEDSPHVWRIHEVVDPGGFRRPWCYGVALIWRQKHNRREASTWEG